MNYGKLITEYVVGKGTATKEEIVGYLDQLLGDVDVQNVERALNVLVDQDVLEVDYGRYAAGKANGLY